MSSGRHKPVVLDCYNNFNCPRAISSPIGPTIRPIIPVRGYWIPEPPSLPAEYTAVFVEPSAPLQGQPWYPSPIVQQGYNALPPTLPPLPLYGPCLYHQNYSPQTYYPGPDRNNTVRKHQFLVTPPPHGFSTANKVNPNESPRKYRSSSITTVDDTFVTPKHKKHKSLRLSDRTLVQTSIEDNENYKTYNQNNELHPEVLAEWRKSLKKSKESYSSHKLKIEICLKKEDNIQLETKQNPSNVEKKKVTDRTKLEMNGYSKENNSDTCLSQRRQQNEKMSASNSTDDEKTPFKDGSKSSKYKNLSSENKKSALRFIPSQMDKIHKRITFGHDGPQASPLKRRSMYSPITRALETYRDEHSRSPTTSSLTSGSSLVSLRQTSLATQESCSSTQNPESDLNSELVATPNSSVYITPERTPPSKETPEFENRQHSRFKRSLSDEYKDESYSSSNSSFNYSSFYTPESSPSKFNCAKRLKTRWSDMSSFSVDNSMHLKWRPKSLDSSEKRGIEPELIGYQMVGDSQFCRFGQQLLGLERVAMPNSSGRIGICVSGQTITDLHRRVRENFYPISEKIILMIGTNDFLRNVDVGTMCEELSALIRTLQKSVSNIILLTLPPIPKLEKKQNMIHFKLLEVYNNHIRSLGNGEDLRIADISPLYMSPSPYQRCKMHLFEVFFAGPARRLDLIHLNRCGLEIIRKYILDQFLR